MITSTTIKRSEVSRWTRWTRYLLNWFYTNDAEEYAKKIVRDLIPLHDDIIVMNAAVRSPPEGMSLQDMENIRKELTEARETETRALDYLAELGVDIQKVFDAVVVEKKKNE